MKVLYENPKTVEEALALKAGARFIAGGTDLGVALADPLFRPGCLVDITGIDRLLTMETGPKGILIGACVTADRISRSDKLPACLVQGAAALGSPQIRNMATLGGNICNASPCGDTLSPLMVLEAVFILASRSGSREVAAGDFFTGPKQTVLGEDELLVQVRIPPETGRGFSGFRMIGKRNGQAISQVNAAVWAEAEGEVLRNIRMAAGSVAPVPLRMTKTEKLLEGKSLCGALLEEMKESVREEIAPISDVRASRDYRREVTGALFEEIFRRLLAERGRV